MKNTNNRHTIETQDIRWGTWNSRHTIGIPSSLRSFSPICFKAVISTCIINPINQRFAERYSIPLKTFRVNKCEDLNFNLHNFDYKKISYIWWWQQKAEAIFKDQKLYKQLNYAYIENLFTFMKAIINILRERACESATKSDTIVDEKEELIETPHLWDISRRQSIFFRKGQYFT